jgi:hypothetical protein
MLLAHRPVVQSAFEAHVTRGMKNGPGDGVAFGVGPVATIGHGGRALKVDVQS